MPKPHTLRSNEALGPLGPPDSQENRALRNMHIGFFELRTNNSKLYFGNQGGPHGFNGLTR